MLIYIESCYRIRLNTSVKYKGCNYLFCHGLFIFNKMFDFFKKKRKHTEFLFSNCEAFKVLDLRSCPSCCCSFTRQCSMYSSHLKTRRVLSQRRWVRLRGQAKDVRNGFDYLKKFCLFGWFDPSHFLTNPFRNGLPGISEARDSSSQFWNGKPPHNFKCMLFAVNSQAGKLLCYSKI